MSWKMRYHQDQDDFFTKQMHQVPRKHVDERQGILSTSKSAANTSGTSQKTSVGNIGKTNFKLRKD